MKPYLIAAAIYLVIGLFLSRNVLRAKSHRRSLWDVVVGAATMPVLFVILLACILFEDLWKRLLIALDYEPPEEMRAGPETPAARDPSET